VFDGNFNHDIFTNTQMDEKYKKTKMESYIKAIQLVSTSNKSSKIYCVHVFIPGAKHCLFCFATLYSTLPEISDEMYRDLFRLTWNLTHHSTG
jgi:hypothetical protein